MIARHFPATERIILFQRDVTRRSLAAPAWPLFSGAVSYAAPPDARRRAILHAYGVRPTAFRALTGSNVLIYYSIIIANFTKWYMTFHFLVTQSTSTFQVVRNFSDTLYIYTGCPKSF